MSNLDDFELDKIGTFKMAPLRTFGNSYVETLVQKTLEDAENQQLPELTALIEKFRAGALETIDCVQFGEALAKLPNEDARLRLARSARATVKHVRTNQAFGAKMRQYRPTQREDRLKYADSQLADMKARNAYPSAFTLNDVLRECSTFEEGLARFNELMKRGVKPNGFTLTQLVKLSADPAKASQLIEDFSLRGIEPNAYVLNAHIGTCKSLTEAEGVLRHYGKKGTKPDAGTLAALVKSTANVEEAKGVIEKYEKKGIVPATITMNATLTKAASIDEARELIAFFKEKGVERDDATMCIGIKIAFDTGEYATAMRYISALKRREGELDHKTAGIVHSYERKIQQRETMRS